MSNRIPDGLEAKELQGHELWAALVEDFKLLEVDTQPMALEPQTETEQQRIKRVLGEPD